MQIVIICDALEWDYEKYISQPKWFTALLLAKRSVDANPKHEPNYDTLKIDE